MNQLAIENFVPYELLITKNTRVTLADDPTSHKKLIVYFEPAEQLVTWKVEQNNEDIGYFFTLKEAVEAYNKS
jgi:hypothetical protein